MDVDVGAAVDVDVDVDVEELVVEDLLGVGLTSVELVEEDVVVGLA